jgi:hypothetical protein
MKTINEFINERLQSEYARVSKPFLTQINALSVDPNSPMQKSLEEFDIEADRLQAQEEKLLYENEILQDTLDQYGNLTGVTAGIIQANSDTVQGSGIGLAAPAVTALVFSGLTDAVISSGGNPVSPAMTNRLVKAVAGQGVNWNMLSADNFAFGYTNSQEWIDKMNKWGSGYADLTNNHVQQWQHQRWKNFSTITHSDQILVNRLQ